MSLWRLGLSLRVNVDSGLFSFSIFELLLGLVNNEAETFCSSAPSVVTLCE